MTGSGDAAPGAASVPRRRLPRVAGGLVTLALLVVAGTVVARRWEAVGGAGGLPGALPAAAATACYVAANALLAGNWAALVRLTGRRLPWRAAAWVWSVSQLSRYTLSGAQVGGRALAGRRYGVPALAGALSAVVEFAWMLCATGAIALATAPWWLPGAGRERWLALAGALPVAGVAAALVRPGAALAALERLARAWPLARASGGRLAGWTGRVRLDRGSVARLTARYAANTALRHAAFLALFVAVGGDLRRAAPLAMGAYALGSLAGAAAVFAPAGLGVREGVAALVLAPAIGGGPALVLVASARLLEVVAEVTFLGLARALRPPAVSDGAQP